MAKKSRLLSVLQAAEDFLVVFDSYFRDPIWVTESLAASPDKARRSLNYLRRKDKVDKDFLPEERGKQVLGLINQNWDELWRIVSYDIPEKNRNKRRLIRQNLYELGFKQLQRSVWLSPLSVDEYIKKFAQKNQPDNFCFFVGRLFAQNSREIVGSLWPVDQWQKQAQNLIIKLKKQENTAESREEFWDLILSHPKAPLDLLPYNWPLKDLVETFVAAVNG